MRENSYFTAPDPGAGNANMELSSTSHRDQQLRAIGEKLHALDFIKTRTVSYRFSSTAIENRKKPVLIDCANGGSWAF